MRYIEEIIKYFPININQVLIHTLEQNKKIAENLQEIRVRVGRPIILKTIQADIVIQYAITQNEILQILEKL